jgi:hypothetical protein
VNFLVIEWLAMVIISSGGKKLCPLSAILIMKPILVFPAPLALETPKSVF